MLRMLLAGFAPALLCLAGCAEPAVPCETLCARARSCQTAMGEALVARLPSKSPALRQARRELRRDLLPGLLKTCPERCAKLTRSTWWRRQLAPCAKRTGCDAFARCFVPALEP